MKWHSHLIIGLATIFIATFMLVYVSQNIEQITERCKVETSENQTGIPGICEKLSPFTLPIIVALLIVAGFIIIICITSYILLSPKGLVWLVQEKYQQKNS